ncbi:uncharacterized protein LOC108679393 [Hyalella azteca]|uniref:Uncharacterized protein LOC108679393 n=1 Tax=Hyalella azteca TaxID=294128 RepID=A0A8B7PBN4_HYAAZ|nr:uncharacterized protein LOC108679393 [Hyalella azteca]
MKLKIIFFWCMFVYDKLVSADTMERLSGRKLPQNSVVSSRPVKSVCECKNSCFDDLDCRGCESEPLPNGRQMCHFTNTNFTKSDFSTSNGSVSFIKHGLCDPPYFPLDGVGCIFVSSEPLLFHEAVISGCPPGFRLFTPSDDQQYWAATKYLLEKYLQPRDDGKCGPNFPLADGTPAACNRTGPGPAMCCRSNGTCTNETLCTAPGSVDYRALTKSMWTSLTMVGSEWKFDNGRVIPNATGSSYWGPYDPKSGTAIQCAAMWYAPGRDTLYHLANADCNSYKAPSFCHRRI